MSRVTEIGVPCTLAKGTRDIPVSTSPDAKFRHAQIIAGKVQGGAG